MSDSATHWHDGADGSDPPRLHPEAVRTWRNEMSASINKYLSELRSLEAALTSYSPPKDAPTKVEHYKAPEPVRQPPSQPNYSEPAYREPAPSNRPAYSEPAPAAAPPPNPSSSEEDSFDTRLANLKKMIAEKLTNAESNQK